MYRCALLGLLIACSKPPKDDPGKTAAPGSAAAPEVIAAPKETAPTTAGAEDPCKLTDATKERAQNPMFQLKPEEGTLTIGKVDGKAGAAATADIKLAPGSGYHVATDYPIKLWLEAPDGVTLDKTCFKAGGRTKDQGDAAALSEQGLAMAVNATAAKAGTFTIQGVFSFGICEKDSCHPRTQPITIQVAAN